MERYVNRTGKRWMTAVLMALILVFVAACALPVGVQAHEVPDKTRSGSVKMEMNCNGAVVTDGTLSIYRVGEVEETNGDYGFVLTGDFKDCGYSLEDLESTELISALTDYVEQQQLKPFKSLENTDGQVTFSGLELGLYLVVQTEASEGYYPLNPFLISVPFWNEATGSYLYDVSAYGKFKLEETPINPEEPKPSVTPQAAGKKLAQTGQLNWPIPLLAIIGMLLILFGWTLRMSKQGDGSENGRFGGKHGAGKGLASAGPAGV